MKNIIIRKEWIEILERQSMQLRDTVMGAVYSFAIRGVDPTDLEPKATLAYEFIKTEMLRLDESLDFDAATEAAIKKKRAAERRAERAAQKAAEREAQRKEQLELRPKVLRMIKNRTTLPKPLPPSGKVPFKLDLLEERYYEEFQKFYDRFPGEKEDSDLEFARLKHQFPHYRDVVSLFCDRLKRQLVWRKDMELREYELEPFPSMRDWITNECWTDTFPQISV